MSLTIQSSNEVSMSPVIANPTGKKMADRVASIMVNANIATAVALITEKGTIGKQAREIAAQGGVANIVSHCSNGNYKSLVDYLAIKLNAAVMVRTRAEYEALPYLLDLRIMDAESKGSVSGEKLALKLSAIRIDVVNIQAAAAEMYARKAAERAAQQAEVPAVAN